MVCVTKQELIDAKADVDSLEAIVNGPLAGPTSSVTTRLGTVVKTVSRVLSELTSIFAGLTLNKNLITETTSLKFTTNNSGRAEIGLTGDDKLHVKTSADGAAWREHLVLDHATGRTGFNTAAPEGIVHYVWGAAEANPISERIQDNPAGAGFTGRKARGTRAAKTALLEADVVQNFFAQGYDGANYIACANLRWFVDGPVSVGSIPTKIEFWTFTPGVGSTSKFEIKPDGTARPVIDNAYALGSASNRWASIWAANGVIQTSDIRDKILIDRINGKIASKAVDAINPALFKWKNGTNFVRPSETEKELNDDGKLVPKMETINTPGKRTHAGFFAQEVKAAMDAAGADFGVWGLDDANNPESRQWLRPDQLTPILWAALKQTRLELAELKASLAPKPIKN